MDRSGIILAIAIALLFVANIKFSEIAYFYPLHLIMLNLIGLLSALLFFLAYAQRGKTIKTRLKINKYFLITLLMFFVLILFQFVWIAVLITLAALYIIAFASGRLRGARFYCVVAIVLIAASVFAYLPISGLRGANWKGIDEIAYNYYASYMLLHGTNPYKVSMLPILTAHNITPTYQLNGTVETAYDYPALSFLPVLFLGLFTLHNFLPFIAAVIFITTLSVFLIYRNSRYNALALIPIVAWLTATYVFMGTIDQYISVAIFLLLAYTERKHLLLSGVFLGLAASTIQLSWFAIPFFLILTLKEKGRRALLTSFGMMLLVFLVINSYFLILGPVQFLNNIFGLFGASKLLLVGTNIMQVLVKSYGVALWCPLVISVTVLLSSMVLFYFYTKTLKPLMAIVPAFIFMLTWHNFLMYGLAYVPLLIVLCYEKDDNSISDMTKKTGYITAVFAALVILSLAIVVYAHAIYTRENTLEIGNMALSAQMIPGTSAYKINGLTVNVTNNGDGYENVSLFIINLHPPGDGIFLASNYTAIAPHSTKEYNTPYSVNDIKGNSSIYLMAFSTDYIRSAEFDTEITGNSIVVK